MKKELSARTNDEQRTAADNSTSASLDAKRHVSSSSPVDIVYGIAIFVMITIMLLGMVLWAIGY